MYKVMAVNAGSSSLKYKLYEMPEEKALCSGNVEKIGLPMGIFGINYDGKKIKEEVAVPNHAVAVSLVLEALTKYGIVSSLDEIKCVGHRVVQGGKYFAHSAEFDDKNAKIIESLTPLDPLHAPAHLTGWKAFKEALPDVPAIAVFDTAFHQTMKEEDYLYPIPYEMSVKYDCRRYGAHGTSHNYLADTAIKHYFGGKKEGTKILSCHIGSGSSLCAIEDGKCIATTMGLTPLGGVMMGTRTGDMDPSVMDYLSTCTGKDVHELYDIFNKKSGLYGVGGISSGDTRDIEEAALKGNKQAEIAGDLFARRIADFIGQYYVRLGRIDLMIFSAGIGENSSYFREKILHNVEEALGLKIDYELNKSMPRGSETVLSLEDSKTKVVVIPTDEEIMIARDCYRRIVDGTLE